MAGKTYEITAPNGKTYEITAPEGASERDVLAYAQKQFSNQTQAQPKQPESTIGQDISQGALNVLGGALSGAASIGNTIMAPIDAAARAAGISNSFIGRNDRRQATQQGLESAGVDRDSLGFKGAELGTQIAGTAGAPVAAARGMAMIPQVAKYAPVLASGGFNLGNAATGSSLANAGIRAAGGAAGGAMQAGLIDPENTGMGAAVGAVTPGAIQMAGMAGDAIRRGGEAVSTRLMQSAVKPEWSKLDKGEAQRAIATLLREGINPTMGGVQKMRGMIDDIGGQVDDLIANSSANVSKSAVLDRLGPTRQQFMQQVTPEADMKVLNAAASEFANHPAFTPRAPAGNAPWSAFDAYTAAKASDDIPVQLAQQLKQGTYRQLGSKPYGELGGASTEAQKSLARGLKDEISRVVPEVGPLNARQADLLNALNVARRRAYMESNKDIGGLMSLAGNPVAAGAFLADRTALVKALLARGVNRATNVPVPQGVPQLLEQYGVLGAPSVALTSP